MIKEIKITKKQTKWLDDHGGRNIHDVGQDEEGLFTLMSSGEPNKDMKIRLPE